LVLRVRDQRRRSRNGRWRKLHRGRAQRQPLQVQAVRQARLPPRWA
jgi:hypothetical protein